MTLLTSIEAEKPDAMTLQSDAIIPAVSLSNVSLSLCFSDIFLFGPFHPVP
jgi:hypothetical protein